MRHGKRLGAAVLVLALVGLLSGCMNKSEKLAQELLSGVDQRDGSKYIHVAMDAGISYQDGSGCEVYAEWEDAGGVRHLISCRSDIEHDGVDESMVAEAWADKGYGKTFIYTDGTGWMERDYADNADVVPALDLDAALSYIGRMARTDDAKKAEARELDDGWHDVTWQARFSDVRKLAGDYGSTLTAYTALVTAGFDPDGKLQSVSIFSECDEGVFDVRITLIEWNSEKVGLSIPDNIISDTGPDFVIDAPEQDPMASYNNEYAVPEDFDDDILTVFASTIVDSGEQFDKIQGVAIPGGHELQYHSHGNIGEGYWFGVVAIDGYGASGAGSRLEELAAYNDAWYGGRIVNPTAPEENWEGMASWTSMHPDDQAYKLEMCFLYGDVCVDTQIEVYLADDVTLENLLDNAMYMLRTAGLCK